MPSPSLNLLPRSGPIPRAVQVIVALHLIAALAFGLMAHLDSSNQFPDLVTNDDGLFAVGLYANRNIGIGLALLAALVLASRGALAGLMLARLLTDGADLVMAFTQVDGAGEVIGQLVFFAILFATEISVLLALRSTETPVSEIQQGVTR